MDAPSLCLFKNKVEPGIAVKWLLRYVQPHMFNAFGWYRIALGIAILLLLH